MVGCALVRDAATATSMTWLTLRERQLGEGDHHEVRGHRSVGSRLSWLSQLVSSHKNQKRFFNFLTGESPRIQRKNGLRSTVYGLRSTVYGLRMELRATVHGVIWNFVRATVHGVVRDVTFPVVQLEVKHLVVVI